MLSKQSDPNKIEFNPKVRHYQLDGAAFLYNARKALLADQMGLGKTVQAILAMQIVANSQEGLRSAIILCPASAMYTWLTELKKWAPELSDKFQVVQGTKAKREEIWKSDDVGNRKSFLITTYASLLADHKNGLIQRYWQLLIADEAHKFKNRKTKTFKAVKNLFSIYTFLLTGTPASRGPSDIWTLLNILSPRVYTSYWRFIDSYCITSQNLWGGLEIIGTKNMDELQDKMRPLFLRRTKKEVTPELPPKTRQLIEVDMEADQLKVYKSIHEDMVADIQKILDLKTEVEPVISSDVLAKITRLRQVLTCPKMLSSEMGYGGGLETIADILEDLPDEERRVVIFTSFPRCFEHITQLLTDRAIAPGRVFNLRGGMKSDDIGYQIESFRTSYGVMLCSIDFAEGFSLEFASTCFFIGYSWRPEANYQAEDRLHRMTTSLPVNAYYIQHRGTIDDRVLEVLNTKQTNVNALLNPARFTDLLELVKNPRH